jgi:hypothetical protein
MLLVLQTSKPDALYYGDKASLLSSENYHKVIRIIKSHIRIKFRQRIPTQVREYLPVFLDGCTREDAAVLRSRVINRKQICVLHLDCL